MRSRVHCRVHFVKAVPKREPGGAFACEVDVSNQATVYVHDESERLSQWLLSQGFQETFFLVSPRRCVLM